MVLTVKSVDVHQHLWPEDVLAVLERRSAAPRARRRGRCWRIDLPGEPSFEVDPVDHEPEQRARELNVDRALVALSPPVGAEGLPAREALAVVAAWQLAVEALPEALGWWALVPDALRPEMLMEIDGLHGEDHTGFCIKLVDNMGFP